MQNSYISKKKLIIILQAVQYIYIYIKIYGHLSPKCSVLYSKVKHKKPTQYCFCGIYYFSKL